MSGAGITIIGASAGSGKTHRLTHEVIAAVGASAGVDRVDLAGLVAVTFTKRAHAELEARIRHKLVAEEAYDEAMRLPLAYLGTVHAAALRLLQEFAIDAGLSPRVDVVAGNETKLLRQAFEGSLDEDARRRLDELAARLELRFDYRTRRNDWVTPVADIMSLARSNRIAPGALAAMAERSVERLLALLPRPSIEGEALDLALTRELDASIASLSTAHDPRTNTADALSLLRASREAPRRRRAPLVGLVEACSGGTIAEAIRGSRPWRPPRGWRAMGEHPRMHQELRDATHAIFDAARAGLVAYQEWKRERRVVDYVDMIDGALDLVDHKRVRADLSRRLQLIVVDEFQDTSHDPSSYSSFACTRSQVVQSGSAIESSASSSTTGADPGLDGRRGRTGWRRDGGTRDRLGDNHRSRPELVHACSELFAAALARHGFTREEVVVALGPTRTRRGPQGAPAVRLLGARRRKRDRRRRGRGRRRAPATRGASRDAHSGSRDEGGSSASPERRRSPRRDERMGRSPCRGFLHARGVRAAIARAGLFETPEGTLADAALRWLLDGGDTLALSDDRRIDGLGGGRSRRLAHASSPRRGRERFGREPSARGAVDCAT